jgi:hypothetical protein
MSIRARGDRHRRHDEQRERGIAKLRRYACDRRVCHRACSIHRRAPLRTSPKNDQEKLVFNRLAVRLQPPISRQWRINADTFPPYFVTHLSIRVGDSDGSIEETISVVALGDFYAVVIPEGLEALEDAASVARLLGLSTALVDAYPGALFAAIHEIAAMDISVDASETPRSLLHQAAVGVESDASGSRAGSGVRRRIVDPRLAFFAARIASLADRAARRGGRCFDSDGRWGNARGDADRRLGWGADRGSVGGGRRRRRSRGRTGGRSQGCDRREDHAGDEDRTEETRSRRHGGRR